MADETTSVPTNGNGNIKVRWKNRRQMAWVSLISMLLVTVVIMFTDIVPESRLIILTDVITWFYFSMSSIIGMYIGAATWANIKNVH